MRIFHIILLITLISCKTETNSIESKNSKTSWQTDNLIGKVKEMTLYMSETETLEEKTVNFKKKYSFEGDLVYQAKYDIFGKLESVFSQEIINDSIVFNVFETIGGFKSTTTAFLDSLKRTLKSVSSSGDSTELTAIFTYDTIGRISSVQAIQNNDTSFNTYDYIYSENDKIESIIHTTENEFSFQQFINICKYDNEENLIEETEKVVVKYFDEQGKLDSLLSAAVQPNIKRTIYTYKKGKLESSIDFSDDEIVNQKSFDLYGNILSELFYLNGSIVREFKYKYKFDGNRNWTKKTVYVKEQTSDFTLSHIELRELEYFNK